MCKNEKQFFNIKMYRHICLKEKDVDNIQHKQAAGEDPFFRDNT